jgi:anti-sigma regulatory factor (Ser/Thr protein kinase)
MSPEPAGFLMFDSWAVDLVLAHKFELTDNVDAPWLARKRLTELLAERLSEDEMFDVAVLTTEIVTNAFRHGGAGEDETIVVHVAIAADVLRIEVCDRGQGFSRPEVPRPRADGGGNGLLLVERLSSSWGVAGDDGTCVWFERALEPAEPYSGPSPPG